MDTQTQPPMPTYTPKDQPSGNVAPPQNYRQTGEEQPEQPSSLPKQPLFVSNKKWLIIGLIILALILGTLLAGNINKKEIKETAATPTPTQTPTPTPIRQFSPVASDSAFLSIESSVSSLSSYLNGLQMNDTTLSPPSIELDLEFNK